MIAFVILSRGLPVFMLRTSVNVWSLSRKSIPFKYFVIAMHPTFLCWNVEFFAENGGTNVSFLEYCYNAFGWQVTPGVFVTLYWGNWLNRPVSYFGTFIGSCGYVLARLYSPLLVGSTNNNWPIYLPKYLTTSCPNLASKLVQTPTSILMSYFNIWKDIQEIQADHFSRVH